MRKLKSTITFPTSYPKGFILVRDTREQKKMFRSVQKLNIIDAALPHGDYSIKGFEDQFTVERKMRSDFVSYIVDYHAGKKDKTGRKSAFVKVEALGKYKFAGLLLGGLNYDDLQYQLYRKDRRLGEVPYAITPRHINSFIVSINIRYGIHFFAHRSRRVCEGWILDRAVKFYNIMRAV